MAQESHSSLAMLQSQLEEYKEKSRKEVADSQKQAKDRSAEVEKMQFTMGRLQDEVGCRLSGASSCSQPARGCLWRGRLRCVCQKSLALGRCERPSSTFKLPSVTKSRTFPASGKLPAQLRP